MATGPWPHCCLALLNCSISETCSAGALHCRWFLEKICRDRPLTRLIRSKALCKPPSMDIWAPSNGIFLLRTGLNYIKLAFLVFICRFLQKQHKICCFLACCLHVNDRLLYKNKNAEDDRKSENLFIFKLNLQTILLTRKLKNYRVFNLLVYFQNKLVVCQEIIRGGP